MTDFFADLEQELRGAHGRRSRPAVPVRPIVLAVTVLAAIVAVASFVPSGEHEAVQAPPVNPGWTAYAPLDCDRGKIVDGRIPDELVDRFAILRGDVEPLDLPAGEVPLGVVDVVRQSLRRVPGPGKNEYVFAVARLAGEDCAPGPPVACLISIQSERPVCLTPETGKPPLVHLAEPLDDRRRVVAVLAGDEIERVRVNVPDEGASVDFDLDANVGFQTVPSSDVEVTVEVVDP